MSSGGKGQRVIGQIFYLQIQGLIVLSQLLATLETL